MGSKDEVHQAQQGTDIPLNKEKKDADIQKGIYSIVSSFCDHVRDGTMHLLTYSPIHMSVNPPSMFILQTKHRAIKPPHPID